MEAADPSTMSGCLVTSGRYLPSAAEGECHSLRRPSQWQSNSLSFSQRYVPFWNTYIGRTDHEQIRSRINNNWCRTFQPRRPLSAAYKTQLTQFGTQLTKAYCHPSSVLCVACFWTRVMSCLPTFLQDGLDCFLLACMLGHREIVCELLTRDKVDQNVVAKVRN